MDHGGVVLWPHPPPGGRHREAVCGCVHRLDDGPGVAQGLHAYAGCQGAQHVRPDHPQTPLQRLCAKVGSQMSEIKRILLFLHYLS